MNAIADQSPEGRDAQRLDAKHASGGAKQSPEPEGHAGDELARELERLIAARKHEQGLSRQNHPMAFQVSVAGEQRVNRAIAEMAPRILAALKASPTTEPNPNEGMQVAERGAFVRGDDVMKPKGYPFPGTVVAAFDTLAGESRFVVESRLAPGMLHIFSAKQITLDLPPLTSASNLSLIGPM